MCCIDFDAMRNLGACLLILIGCTAAPGTAAAGQPPVLLTYEHLRQLYQSKSPSPQIDTQLHLLLTTPFVSNRAFAEGVRPLRPAVSGLGRCLVVAQWNIERGLEFDAVRLALGDPARFSAFLNERGTEIDAEERKNVLEQARTLQQADVIVLNEVDWGVNRRLFRNVAADLAADLRMNYAYGVEFVEVDPVTMGLDQSLIAKEVAETYTVPGEDEEQAATQIRDIMKPDPARYRGLHGSAILSRYRLDNVRLRPFTFQGHDWYDDELRRTSQVARAQGWLSSTIFNEQLMRQVRRGGRMMLTADLVDPELPSGRVTVVATHLEDVTKPSNRQKQLAELLGDIQGIGHPVNLAGDMNTSMREGLPITLNQLLKERFGSGKWWAKQGLANTIMYATPAGWLYKISRGMFSVARKVNDPTATNIPLIGENPEAKFFTTLEKFRFADGGTFDFRGDRDRAWKGHSGTLSNSNERTTKGFLTTQELDRTYGPFGAFKLDWIFVKPSHLTDPHGTEQPYRFAPHFGRTMRRLNHSLPGHISDHSPITVTLPLEEPEKPSPTPAG